ncbi:MAG: DUF4278 domain-containing protein [Leptolyngbya sp. SIO1E4]|nr:DUF4278 domain-containing protein [Leptolyngbya sp. SIO1E4]
MQLTYRGAHYTYAPNPVPKFGSILATGIYRGAPVSFRALAEMPEQPRFSLKWRGVPYRSGPKVHRVQSTGPAATPAMTATAPVATSEPSTPLTHESAIATSKLSILERARTLFIRRHQKVRQREQSMLARLDEEVGLAAKDAANYESQVQGKVPHDFAGYDRSGTAMS